ncbi:MAG: hypothetical protein HW380_53 [Magnetococcales bacterium]|nr:hypothetical protein [Magnetococcales bacterium]
MGMPSFKVYFQAGFGLILSRKQKQFVPVFEMVRLEAFLYGAIGYIAPVDKVEGCAQLIFDERKRKLTEVQKCRKAKGSSQLSEGDNQSNNMKPIDISINTEEGFATG